jgi:hypothetical protein
VKIALLYISSFLPVDANGSRWLSHSLWNWYTVIHSSIHPVARLSVHSSGHVSGGVKNEMRLDWPPDFLTWCSLDHLGLISLPLYGNSYLAQLVVSAKCMRIDWNGNVPKHRPTKWLCVLPHCQHKPHVTGFDATKEDSTGKTYNSRHQDSSHSVTGVLSIVRGSSDAAQ